MVLVGGARSGDERSSQICIGKNANERGLQFSRLIGRDENDAGFGDRRSSFTAGTSDERNAAGDGGDGAAAARGNSSADKQQNITSAESFDDVMIVEDAVNGKLDRKIAEAFLKSGFAELGVSAKNGEAELAQSL